MTTTSTTTKLIIVIMATLMLFVRTNLAFQYHHVTRRRSIITTTSTTSAAAAVAVAKRWPTTTPVIRPETHHRGLSSSSSSSLILSGQRLSNQELVERRISVSRAKRQARENTIQQRIDKNLHIKRLLSTQTTTDSNNNNSSSSNNNTVQEQTAPALYAVKVWVDETLREELKLSGREKRGRVFIEKEEENNKNAATSTLKGLKQELHSFFTSLKKNTFLLTASIPKISPEGKILSEHPDNSNDDNDTTDSWTIESDEDVIKTFAKADEFFLEKKSDNNNNLLKRPSIQINIWKDPNAPPPPPPPQYLMGMADPNLTESMTMISFYAFPPSGIDDPEGFAFDLKKKWKPFNALGRVYVAEEGVNAQMSIPTNVLPNFMDCCRSVPQLGKYMENDINIDPKPLSLEEFSVAGVPINNAPAPPFRNLHVRVRTQIVADGLDKNLDWQSAGYDMPPMEWHEKLKQAKDIRNRRGAEDDDDDDVADDIPILLDCRNDYETSVGIFDGAEPLGTENFRDSWDVLKDRLADTPKDAPIMTYCTGGIRCVKVGAYLTQEMGFTNVSRLAGGIIAYDRTLGENAPAGEESMFKGTNFVFDGRLGRQITEDALSKCITCGAETSVVSNCCNDNCHKRMVQCEKCRTTFHGTCSEACKQRVLNGAMAPRRQRITVQDATADGDDYDLALEGVDESSSYDNLDDYSVGHSSPIPSVYNEMELNTQAFLPSGSHMVSGSVQGRLLTQLASMTRHGRIIELGTFTGYATACFLEGAKNVGDAIGFTNGSIDGGPYVMTMERDPRAFNVAVAHLKAVAEYGFNEVGAEAVASVRANKDDLPEINEDKVSVSLEGIAGCDLLKVTDALASVESIASGIAGDNLQPSAPFDLVFVDADKTRLLEYVEACLSSDKLLNRGGLIVVDNVLWKGLVLEASSGEFSSLADNNSAGAVGGPAELRKNRRARKLAALMHRFNTAIVNDDRAEVMMLPVRDGLSIIRKK